MKKFLSIVFLVALLFGFFQLSNNYVDKGVFAQAADYGRPTEVFAPVKTLRYAVGEGSCKWINNACVGICPAGFSCGDQRNCPLGCLADDPPPEPYCLWQANPPACVGICPGGSHCEGDATTCGPCVLD